MPGARVACRVRRVWAVRSAVTDHDSSRAVNGAPTGGRMVARAVMRCAWRKAGSQRQTGHTAPHPPPVVTAWYVCPVAVRSA
ncbi:hypothetical protein SRIMM317S_03971 [Streptomyces rimosus subsp. rimosus]